LANLVESCRRAAGGGVLEDPSHLEPKVAAPLVLGGGNGRVSCSLLFPFHSSSDELDHESTADHRVPPRLLKSKISLKPLKSSCQLEFRFGFTGN
jgi:hypothetical protein